MRAWIAVGGLVIGVGVGATFAATHRARGAVPSSVDAIPFASPHAAAVRTPSGAAAWGGVRRVEQSLSDRVVDYELEAELDPVAHTVEGKERLRWRNRSDRPIKTVYVHLYLNAFESAGSTFFTEEKQLESGFRSGVGLERGEWGHIELRRVAQGGAAVPWRFVHPDGGPESDHTVARFDLPQAVAPGGTLTLDLEFHDQLPRVIARTGYFGRFHLVAQWFPKLGVLELPGERGATEPRWNVHEFHLHSEFYADFGRYDVKLTVPREFTVGAVGEEVDSSERGGRTTHHFVQDDVHDFAFTAFDGFAPPRIGRYQGGHGAVTVRVLYPPDYEATAQPALDASLASLRYFSETLGPYPYRTVTCVVPPRNAEEAGGMEYPTFFTVIGATTVEPETLTASEIEGVTIHEFGHGYFYGILASNEFEEPMLDEGLNEFWDQRLLRARHEPLWLTTPLLRKLHVRPALDGFAYERGSLVPHPPDALGQNSWDRLSSQSYGSVYGRTAVAFADLEARLGGDVLARAFAEYYRRWRFRHPSTADLEAVLKEVSGQPQLIEQFFDQQIYDVSAINDRVVSVVSEELLPDVGTHEKGGRWTEETSESIRQQVEATRAEWKKSHPQAQTGPFPYCTQVTVVREGAVVPQRLRVTFDDGSREEATWSEPERWHRFQWVRQARAVSAELDPDRTVLLDHNKLDDGRTRERNAEASRRWTLEAGAFVELLSAIFASM